MRYPRLYPDTICYDCAGCNRLEDHKFRGIKPTTTQTGASCRGFVWGYPPEYKETRKKEAEEEFTYGSSMGFNG